MNRNLSKSIEKIKFLLNDEFHKDFKIIKFSADIDSYESSSIIIYYTELSDLFTQHDSIESIYANIKSFNIKWSKFNKNICIGGDGKLIGNPNIRDISIFYQNISCTLNNLSLQFSTVIYFK